MGSKNFIDCRACAKSKEIKDMIYLFKDENTRNIFSTCTTLEVILAILIKIKRIHEYLFYRLKKVIVYLLIFAKIAINN